jgi:NtrC-family two-component system sensor histidine kinase KinB
LAALQASEKKNEILYKKEQERSQELALAYVELRQVETMRDDLTRMIVHDMRSPLTVIGNSLDMIARADTNEFVANSVPDLLEGARGSVKRIMGMIEDLLHVSKFEAGEMRPMFRILATRKLLIRVEQTFQALAVKEKKGFSLTVFGDLPSITADEDLIERVLDNLIYNALKYTEVGGLVELTVRNEDDVLMFRIRDDGPGIPVEYQDRIFDKFVQVTSEKGEPLRKGTGIGLAFCRLAVEAHGGDIWVNSEPGKGSVFSFTLPITHKFTSQE